MTGVVAQFDLVDDSWVAYSSLLRGATGIADAAARTGDVCSAHFPALALAAAMVARTCDVCSARELAQDQRPRRAAWRETLAKSAVVPLPSFLVRAPEESYLPYPVALASSLTRPRAPV